MFCYYCKIYFKIYFFTLFSDHFLVWLFVISNFYFQELEIELIYLFKNTYTRYIYLYTFFLSYVIFYLTIVF